MRYVVQFSGGVGSWMAARRMVDEHGAENVTLLFADTMMEDEDLYRFLDDAVINLGAELVRVADGRNPWEVFRARKFIGNTWVDLCSRILKRELLRAWIDEHCDPATHTMVLGIDWMESHRLDKAKPRWLPFEVIAPMCERPFMDRNDAMTVLLSHDLEPPRLYALGFPHNNCGGFCVKAGVTQFALLHRTMPERYAWHEAQEIETQKVIGKPVTVLSRKRKGVKRPLSLTEFRLELEAQQSFPDDDWGGCGCALE